jgi:hypothetical protein
MPKFTHEQSDAAAQLDSSLDQFRRAALHDGGRPWQIDINVDETTGVVTLSGTVGPKEEAKPK